MSRTIIPRPREGSPEFGDVGSSNSTLIRPFVPTALPKRKNVTSACLPCRERKTKCNGAVPCSRCAATNTLCTQPPDPDGRSIAALKRKFDTYEHDQQLLRDLLEVIRDSDDQRVHQLVSLVRSNHGLDEVRDCVAQILHERHHSGQRPSLDQGKVQASVDHFPSGERRQLASGVRRDPLQVATLVDEPPFRVPAEPWTKITEDDGLVSNLISVWLTWDHMMCNWVNPELFLRDMSRAQIGTPHCSPFLVSCILAWACPYSGYKEARSRCGRTSDLMQELIQEAKDLLESELARGPSLTLVQGIMYLYLVMSVQGQDRLGYHYMLMVTGLVQDLSKTPLSRLGEEVYDRDELAAAVDYTCWGIYNIITASYMTLRRPQTMAKPRRKRPRFKIGWTGDMWRPYSMQEDPIACYTEELFDRLCDVSILISRVSCLMFGDQDDATQTEKSKAKVEDEAIHHLLQVILTLSNLPGSPSQFDKVPPSVLIHRLWICSELLSALSCLRNPCEPFSNEVRELANIYTLHIAVEVAQICRYYMNTYSNSIMANSSTHAISMSLYILIDHARKLSDFAGEIIVLCRCLRMLSRRWPMSMIVLRRIQIHAREQRVELPPEVDHLFAEFENGDWKEMDLSEIFSLYPDLKPSMAESDEVIDIGRVVQSMDQLNLEQN